MKQNQWKLMLTDKIHLWSITFLYYNGTKFLLQREIDARDAVTEPPLPFAKCLSASRRYSMEYPRLPPLLG